MAIKLYKSGAWTVFEKTLHGYYIVCAWTVFGKTLHGYYIVKVYSPAGYLIDRIVCDDCRNARDYLKSFGLIARNQ